MQDVLDTAAIDQLIDGVGGGDPTVFRDVAAMFMRLGPEKAGEIRKSFESGDEKALAQAAHYLKGSAGTLGVAQVRADCQRIEATDFRKEDELRDLLNELDQHLAEGIRALEELLAEQCKQS